MLEVGSLNPGCELRHDHIRMHAFLWPFNEMLHLELTEEFYWCLLTIVESTVTISTISLNNVNS